MDKNLGIDWSNGKSNIDVKTGIRYGVISQNSVMGGALEELEPYYGEPSCPKCGNDAREYREGFDYIAECGIWECKGCHKIWYPMEIDTPNECPDCGNEGLFEMVIPPDDWEDKGGDYVCLDCLWSFDSEDAYPDEPNGFTYEKDGYSLVDCLDSDIFVLKSRWYTFSQFCSPCVPGAGNLDNPMEEGVKTYALGHDWFEGGIAPYPVYRVKDDKRIVAERVDVECPNCQGEGRDTVERIAKVRGVTTYKARKALREDTRHRIREDDTFECYRCDGKGTLSEVREREEM